MSIEGGCQLSIVPVPSNSEATVALDFVQDEIQHNEPFHARKDCQTLLLESVDLSETRNISTPNRKSILKGLSEALMRRSLTKIDLSQSGLSSSDSRLIKMALVQNPLVSVLKLCYNNLGDSGVVILASGISEHANLESIDLGFNNVGDEGCRALTCAIPMDRRAWTLHMAGNIIGGDGAINIADLIRRRCGVRKLYLSGNRLGPGGVRAIAQSILEVEISRFHINNKYDQIYQSKNGRSMSSDTVANIQISPYCFTSSLPGSSFVGMQELFLGGTRMGLTGLNSVAKLVGQTRWLKTLSLSNCELTDEMIELLVIHVKSNRENIQLKALHLSFNRITCRGMEYLSHAISGSSSLKELLLDNNEIGDNGAQFVATVIPVLRTLETLNVGFNRIKSPGMKLLMKAVSESQNLLSLSVSGNPVDTTSAKFIAYALAYNISLSSVSLDHCSITTDGQRHIVAGIVSNSRISVREIRGFNIGPIIVTLGFPSVMEHWNNDHVMNFIHFMWERSYDDLSEAEADEKRIDPLHFLPSDGSCRSQTQVAPLEASVVVEYAQKAFRSFVHEGVDVFSRRSCHSIEPLLPSVPLPSEIIHTDDPLSQDEGDSDRPSESLPDTNNQSCVASTQEFVRPMSDPSRKKLIVEWLCSNIQHLNKMSQKPFSSSELWRLHQHYFTPVVNESGGNSSIFTEVSPKEPTPSKRLGTTKVWRDDDSTLDYDASISDSADELCSISGSEPLIKSTGCGNAGQTSFPMLKRKVSYRFLGDAALASTPNLNLRNRNNPQFNVAMIIESGRASHSLPPKTKRARRNRTRISFLPRVKAKLDSLFDVCHEKALVTMRQLYFVEHAILKGEVNPIDPKRTSRTHLCGDFAVDADMIVIDMI